MDKKNSIPLYYRVAETLKGRIEQGKYKPGDIIPSERELAKEFDVSNITIRKAMGLLVEDGLLSRGRGIGTRVVEQKKKRIPLKITGNFRDWVDSALNRKLKLEVDVLEMRVTSCPEQIAKILDMPPGTQVWRMRRVRELNGEPISYYLTYTLPELLSNASAKDFKKGSFIDVFQKKSGTQLAKIEQNVEATIANMDVASILEVPFGAPLFFIENIYYTSKPVPVSVSQMYFRGDRYIYKSDIMLYE